MQIQQPNLPQAPMKNRRKKNTSSDSFSFPSTPNPDSDFEFGSLTPDSPSSDPCITSPADHLFFNGRLQPHSFPLFLQHHNHNHNHPIAMTNRTSSISSKDSLLLSRSNSTNSRGSISSCSSARTSSSDHSYTKRDSCDRSDRRLLHNKISSLSSSCKGTFMVKKSMVYSAHHQAYGCSQRWQYITPVPALERNASGRRKGESQQKRKEDGTNKRRKKKKKKTTRGFRFGFGLRMFQWFVMTCKQCHAMEPSKRCNKEIVLQKEK